MCDLWTTLSSSWAHQLFAGAAVDPSAAAALHGPLERCLEEEQRAGQGGIGPLPLWVGWAP